MAKPFKPSRKEIVSLLAADLIEKLRKRKAQLNGQREFKTKSYEKVSRELDAELKRISETAKVQKIVERCSKLGNVATIISGDNLNISVQVQVSLASQRTKELHERRSREGSERGNLGVQIQRLDDKIQFLLMNPEAYLLAAMRELPEEATPLFEQLEAMFEKIVDNQLK